MTTVASDQDRMQRLERLDAEAAREWAAYGERLRDLSGSEYEIEEAAAWDELQRALTPIHDERELLTAPAGHDMGPGPTA